MSQLHAAAAAGDVPRVKSLLAVDGDSAVHKRDSDGRTPLLLAARKGHVDVVKRLLKAGAGIKAADTTWGD